MTDVFVKSFTHLKGRHRADDALKFLQRIASLVKPIMRKRGWVLPVLAEFFPNNPNLLGEPVCVSLFPYVSSRLDVSARSPNQNVPWFHRS
jgi:hypothetical protein